jgi:hypothetical protein
VGLGVLASLAAAAGLIASDIGLLGLAVTAGAGLAAGAATLLCWPSARHWFIVRAWCVSPRVRVVPSPRHAHLVTLEVIRRPHPERVRPAPDTWTSPRRVAGGDGFGGTDERDTTRWPGAAVPPPRLSLDEDRAGQDGRSHAPVPADRW